MRGEEVISREVGNGESSGLSVIRKKLELPLGKKKKKTWSGAEEWGMGGNGGL